MTPPAPPVLAAGPPVPRVVPFVTVKRNVALAGRSYGHWWRWSTRPTMNCRLFQLALFDAVGLVDGTGNYRTRGAGCPALAPLRRLVSKATGRRRWPGNLPLPGQRVCDVVGDAGRLLLADVDPIRLGPS